MIFRPANPCRYLKREMVPWVAQISKSSAKGEDNHLLYQETVVSSSLLLNVE